MKKKRENAEITLVALVITVIVMLILAGVAINLTIGDNGIFKKSEEGAKIYKNSANDEASSLNDVDNKMGELINQYHGGNGGGDTSIAVEDSKGKKFEDTTTIIDKNKEEVTIPGGFTISPDSSDDVNRGVVVVDANENEFVWVPVPDPTTMYVEETVTLAGGYATTNRYSKLRIRSQETYTATKPSSTTGVREPDFLTDTTRGDASTTSGRGISQLKEVLGTTGSDNNAVVKAFSESMVEEYNAMIDSVIKYKGFYIGRYELTGTVESPTSRSGVILTNQNWYALRKACNIM